MDEIINLFEKIIIKNIQNESENENEIESLIDKFNESNIIDQEKEWNFKGFDLESANSTLDALIFKYSAPLTQVDGRMSPLFDGGSLHGKEINGIPGPETTQKIISTYTSPSFILERTVRPEKRILLVRK